MESDGSQILFGAAVVVLLIGIRAFYTCCETACSELSDGRFKNDEDERGGRALLCSLLEKPFELVAAFSAHRILNAVMLALVVQAAFYSPLLSGMMRLFPMWEQTLLCKVISAAVLIFCTVFVSETLGDGLPKRLVRAKGYEAFAVRSAYMVRLLCMVMKPVTLISEMASRGLARLFGARDTDAAEGVTEEEILMMVDAGNETGHIESSEREMINNVFEFHELAVNDVMTHRTDMVAVSVDAEISEVVYTAINSGFSRIPVFRESIDHIEGIIYVKDLLCLIGTQSADGMTAEHFLREAEFVPESSMCGEVFRMLTAKKLQLAIAVDEYGGTAGLITMEDLVESIVGNIQDEYDNEVEDVTRISDDTYTIIGNADPADTMEILGAALPENSEYDTMSGFIIDLLGRIPEDGETPSVSYGDITFTVLVTEDMRIERIKAVINKVNTEKELTNDEEKCEQKD